MAAIYYVGTSGWHYDHWRERFYPKGLAKPRWLGFYARNFATVELNNSFYHLPSEKAFANWRDSTPGSFKFAVKVSRFITHIKKLKDCEEPLANFVNRARLLDGKLGPLLYQLPPNLHRNDGLLESFLALLPGDLSHVFEFRHESWHTGEVLALLRRYNTGFCVYDMPDCTTPVEASGDFAYIRFHGSEHIYGDCYSDEELSEWAQRIAGLGSGVKLVYIYFNNDFDGFAVNNAQTLHRMLTETSL